MRTSEALDQFWKDQAAVVRMFLDAQPNYAKFAEEVAYILEKFLRSADVEYAAITHRVKTLDSFCEKVVRKGYKDPFREVTDIAGVRIVFLYLSNRADVEAVIEKNLDVVEKANKIDKNDPERFGYGALHYLVRLGKKASGARYDDLKGLVCEVQVRTILQDAWAVVAHHMSYKQESDVPKKLRRKLNALCGLFETADDQFDRLKDERATYTQEVEQQMAKKGPDFRKYDMNLDNLIAYLNWRFPNRERTSREEAADLLSEIGIYGYTHLAQIDDALSSTIEAIKAYEAKYPPTDETGEQTLFAPVGVVRCALELIDDRYLTTRARGISAEGWGDRIREFRPLLKNSQEQNDRPMAEA